MLVVQKYGGTSVETTEKILKIAEKVVKDYDDGNKIVVVVSAMGKTTNYLIDLLNQVNPNANAREYDMIASSGEQISIALMASAISRLGKKSVSLTGFQAGIDTDSTHSRAMLKRVYRGKILSIVDDGAIPIVAGFQGISPSGDITTLGRGGSDTTAVAVAYGIGADLCEIYTDVDGVYSADPRYVDHPKKLDHISYDEMIEMAAHGAKVLHLRSVELARRYHVRLAVKHAHIKSSGTMIEEADKLEEPLVRALTVDEGIVKIVIENAPDIPGIAAKVFKSLSEKHVSLDMIVQSMHKDERNDIAFTVSKEEFKDAFEIVSEVKEEVKASNIHSDDTMAKISIVGVNILGSSDVVYNMFDAIASVEANIDMISTSNSRISCLISKAKVKEASKAVARRFGLEE
jgi:aspartate kinase